MMNDKDERHQKSSFIAIVGSPNAGKSTLVNNILNKKVSIVSPKVQTTRVCIKGIFVRENTQLVFIDTPGIFSPKKFLEKSIVRQAQKSLSDSDTVLLVVDAKKGLSEDIVRILELVPKNNDNIILVINKIDLVRNEDLLPLTQDFDKLYDFKKIFMISALKSDGLNELLDYLLDTAVEGKWLYDGDKDFEMPMKVFLSEITREKIFYNLQEELPYNIAVVTDKIIDDKDIKVYQTLYATKPSHKKIILGKSGAMIKRIGELSRLDMTKLLGKKVHLFLHVKINEQWMQNKEIMELSGFN